MRAVTEAGRKRIRDLRRERVERELRRHEWFAEAPRLVVSGFADLVVVSRELRSLMLSAGLMRADGTDIHPAVKSFREYKNSEREYLKLMVELRAAQASGPLDIVAAMNADEAAAIIEAGQRSEPGADAAPAPEPPAEADDSEHGD